MSSKRYVQVAVNLPLNDVFDYSVPDDLQDSLEVGKRVWVPFRNRTIVGFIVKISDHTKIPRTRDIKEILKSLGFKWASKKKMWYYGKKKSKGKEMNINDIKAKYGSNTVKTAYTQKLERR